MFVTPCKNSSSLWKSLSEGHKLFACHPSNHRIQQCAYLQLRFFYFVYLKIVKNKQNTFIVKKKVKVVFI